MTFHPGSFIPAKNFYLKILKRHGLTLLVQKNLVDPPNTHQSYEVASLSQNPPWSAFGKHFPASLSYPKSEAWGTSGFTYTTLQDAESKFQSLTTPAIATAT